MLVFHERARAMNTWVEATESARARLRRLSVACGECRSAAFRSAWFTWIESHERRSRVFGALSSLRHRNVSLTDHGTEVLTKKVKGELYTVPLDPSREGTILSLMRTLLILQPTVRY